MSLYSSIKKKLTDDYNKSRNFVLTSPKLNFVDKANTFIQSNRNITAPEIKYNKPFREAKIENTAKGAYNFLARPYINSASKLTLGTAMDVGRIATGQKVNYNDLKSPLTKGSALVYRNDKNKNMGIQNAPKGITPMLKASGETAEDVLNLYAPTPAKNLALNAGEQGFKAVVKQGAKQFGKMGLAYGASTGIQKGDNVKEQVYNAGKEAIIAGAGGYVLGGVVGAGGYGTRVAGQVIKKGAKNVISDIKASNLINREVPEVITTIENGIKINKPRINTSYDEIPLSKLRSINRGEKIVKGDYKAPDEIVGVHFDEKGNIESIKTDSQTAKDYINSWGTKSGKINYGANVGKETPKVDTPPITPKPLIEKPIVEPTVAQDTQKYVQEQINKQNQARQVESTGLIGKTKNFIADVKRKLVDSTAPIEDVLYQAKKEGTVLKPSEDITNQIDRVYRTRTLAAQFAKDNGLVAAIQGAPDTALLDQYLIAKHALEVGTETGRNKAMDSKLVSELAPIYESHAQKVIQYGQKLLDYATETGLIDAKTANMLKTKYPNYVPLNRIFSELEKSSPVVGRSGVASLSKQTIVQGLKGSERAIVNPTESLLTKTLDAFNQGERNVAGRQLVSYKDLPAFQGLIREVKQGETAVHTFSYLENGVKKTFETTPEIAAAAKLLDKQQMGFIGKILTMPVRIARVGITGINIPFVGANIAKDQVSGIINSDHALQTSIIGGGGKNFLSSLWNAIGHGKEYDNWIRNAGGGTSFDISRSAPINTVKGIRRQATVFGKVIDLASHPLRSIENAIARSEELTRLQQFTGTKNALLKEGMPLKEAEIAAAKASRENTVNFARSGDWGKALNSTFLYINAGIQGSRTLVRNLANRPVQTATKIGLTVFAPLAAVTAWNLSDPQRKAAYDDIRDSEKENNLVLIPPNPQKDPNTGKWNVIKIPYSQEIANLTIPIRKGIESLQGYDSPGFMDVAKALLGTTTSLNVQSPNALIGQFTPQAVKMPIQSLMNKNLFTGADIVPQYLNGQLSKNLPPEMQVKDKTSGTARLIAKPLGISPIKVEQAAYDLMGGVGSQVVNASDRLLSKVGVVPKDQIGGQSIMTGIKNRFTQATGGQQLTNLFDNKNVKNTPSASTNGLPTSGDYKTVESNGKLYVTFGKNNVKTFDNSTDAKTAIEKDQFDKSGAKYKQIGDNFYSRNKDGSPKVTPMSEIADKQSGLTYTLSLEKAKRADDIKGWFKLQDDQIAKLSKEYDSLDPQNPLDAIRMTEIENKVGDISTEYTKYAGYGGFKKNTTKKAKSLKASSLSSLKSSSKITLVKPTLKAMKAQVSTSTFRRPSTTTKSGSIRLRKGV